MALDPQMKRIIDITVAQNVPPFDQCTPAQAREMMCQRTAGLGPVQDVAAVEDHRAAVDGGAITIRVYRPAATGVLPALVFFHGGGWVIGDLDTHDGICRALANGAECVVASVDYRLAPEHKYPVAAEDAYASLVWMADRARELRIDPRRIAVGGDSAGGNLAAVTALMARDRRGPAPCFQVLIYPVTEHGFDTPSYRENATGYLLTREDMRWFWTHYLAREADGRQPYASPLLAADLGGLPPALVITAEYDPLRDEGEAYARKLREAGVPAALTRYPGLVHGFFRLTLLVDQAKAALAEVTTALRKAFV